MRSFIILVILLAIISIVPTPYYKKITSCVDEYSCTSESSFELGPSIAQMIYQKLQDTQVEIE